MRPRKYDLIPIKFWGKGGHGYMLYDWVHHRGRGAPKLGKQAADLIRYYGSEDEKMMSKELNKRMKLGGPRFAMMAQATRRQGLSNWFKNGPPSTLTELQRHAIIFIQH